MGGAGWFTSSAVTVGFFAFIILQIETKCSFRTHNITIAALYLIYVDQSHMTLLFMQTHNYYKRYTYPLTNKDENQNVFLFY